MILLEYALEYAKNYTLLPSPHPNIESRFSMFL